MHRQINHTIYKYIYLYTSNSTMLLSIPVVCGRLEKVAEGDVKLGISEVAFGKHLEFDTNIGEARVTQLHHKKKKHTHTHCYITSHIFSLLFPISLVRLHIIMFRDKDSSILRPPKRLKLAFTAIYFIVSLSKKVFKKTRSLTGVIHSPPYIAIDIQPVNDDDNDNDNDHDHVPFLADLVKERDFDRLHQYGGVKEVAAVLGTDAESGISGSHDDTKHIIDVFGSNTYKKPPAKSFISFVLEAFKDPTIIILLVCAVLSLGFGIKQHGLKEGWYDGGSIIVAVVLVVAVSAISNFKQSRQFEKLSEESSDIKVEVVRDGRRQPISIFEVVVGDIVCLNIGDQIPADGLFLDGHSLKVDESNMTGESDHVEVNEATNPFLLSGTKVTDGYGHMLVTAVGMNTEWGQKMSSISCELDKQTWLEAGVNKLNSYMEKSALLIAFLLLVVLLIHCLTGHTNDQSEQPDLNDSIKTKPVMRFLKTVIDFYSIVAAMTVVVLAVPEGLPLALSLTLAYSTKKMMDGIATIRKLSAGETMGSATTICTDKTGTLTLNQMMVTEFWLGKEELKGTITSSELDPNFVELLQEGIGLNTTGEDYPSSVLSTSTPEISASPTESAILSWAVFNLDMDLDQLKKVNDILHVEAFNSEKKRSGVLVRRNGGKKVHTHWKGAAEMILAMCSNYYVRSGRIIAMDDSERVQFDIIIKDMAAKGLRCIAFACNKAQGDSLQANEKVEETGMTLLGLVGLKDPCRPGVGAAVQSCRDAGVKIKMITGDNMSTAKTIAIECGILKPNEDSDDAIVEGVTFRNYSQEARMLKVESIRVMARSSPFDKLLMVQCLKQKGHVVAVTGDGNNDAPALKEADIGLSMGIQGTEVAKECSDIVILDNNFTSILTVLKWGRCVYNNIQKFIQFQLTVNVAALVINFVAALSSGEVRLAAVQLLWVNLIIDILGALAFAAEQSTNDVMKKPPVGRNERLITRVMWRNLISQALYQVTVLLTLEFKGNSIFRVNKRVKDTLIFNSFVLCQVFNEFNARKLEEKNIFRGILKNKLFLGIVGMTVVLQVVVVELLKRIANTERLNWGQWGACIGIGALSWPIGWLVKYIPVSSKYGASNPEED
ncbi:calcium-transporting ATPase 12, plasma membrane-type-like [Cornus florida]|uniref:calcium-transporting ATPase 12, plasma membrane-type-like n=1 Tax=Cornus florida TaxID=4283 RepID=UPI00289F3890|nr:calcium-transporting ATPase 12, plasma membrane-type-like [Cornus florida]